MNITTKNSDHDDLYVIATIFNPAGFKARYNLYYNFEQHMKDYGINLVTIECIFGDNSEFQVTKPENPMHIRVSAKDPLWVKENLINIAIGKLPDKWKYVLWLDADIEFIEKDWPYKILESFKRYEVIQVFKYANFLGPSNEVQECHYSFLYALVNELPIEKNYYSQFYPHPGYGWGITRSCFEKIGKLIDFGIVGSGDGHMAFSFILRTLDSFAINPNFFNKNYLKSLFDWQDTVKYLMNEKKLGYADLTINHYFHGFREDRQYVLRLNILTEMQFDPINDLCYNNQGVIQFKENRNDIKSVMRKYFMDRKEDSKKIDGLDMISMNLPFKSPEDVLESALRVKQILEKECFMKIIENIFEIRVINKNIRSNSSSITISRRLTQPISKKSLEMYGENDSSKGSTDSRNISDSESIRNISDSVSIRNLSDSESIRNLSDSESSRNYSDSESSKDLCPDRDQNKSFDDNKMVRKYGSCCSTPAVRESNSRPSRNNNNANNNYQSSQYHNNNYY